jgi:integrase
MARTVKDANLQSRTAREKLKPQKKPYWRTIDPGRHLGYYKGERGGTWIARRYIGGTKPYEEHRLGIADDVHDADGVQVLTFSQAQEQAREWFAECAAPQKKAGPMTVRQAVDGYWDGGRTFIGYIDYLKAEKRSGDDTERRLKAHVLEPPKGRPKIADRLIVDLTKSELEAWRNAMVRDSDDPDAVRKSRDTANRVVTMLKAALNRAFNDEANSIPSDKAWRTLKPFKGVGQSRKLALDAAQRQRLINSTSGAFRNLVVATLYTGSRPAPGEIAQAKVRDFHPDLGTLHIADSKTGPRDVPLTDEAVKWFRAIAAGKEPDDLLFPKDDGSAWGYNHQLRPMREARKRGKLPNGTSMYTLRHTFISEHIMRGTDLKSLADIAGTSIRMIEQHYGHVLASHKRKLVEAAGFNLGIKPPNVDQMRPRAS